MEYNKFLEQKKKQHIDSGFEIDGSKLNHALFEFQKHIVKIALLKGKYAIFSDTGTGKTLMQLEWANHVRNKTQKPVLILAPLAVSGQTIKEGEKFGIRVHRYHVTVDKNQILDHTPEIHISNYEQLDNIDCSKFAGIVLDESSILKNFTGKYRNYIIERFKGTPYKLACTATPSPNDPMELGNHAEFLDVMSYHEMLSMYFIHDGGSTQKWRLKGHAIGEYYAWVSAWAIMLNKPSDIGFNDKGYDLPELHYVEDQIETPKIDNGKLVNDGHVNATDYNATLRQTKELRMNATKKLIDKSTGQVIVWVKQNEEADYLRKILDGYDYQEVRGSDKDIKKERALLDFAAGKYKILITKLKIAQFGLNFQSCNMQIFASLDFSFEGTYQGIRRSWRFGQMNEVFIHLITTDTMQNVFETINKKQTQHIKMQKEMTNAINSIYRKETNMTISDEVKTENYHIIKGDCIKMVKHLKDESIDFSIFSPPFAELYVYSDNIEDMGNSKDYKEFFEHFKYLIKDLHRITKPGRLIALHSADLPIQKGKEGYIGFRDFTGIIIKEFQDAGFIFHDRVTIWKDPVIEMQRTKALGLLHKQIKKDSSMCRTGNPDYLIVFRKHGENQNPIENKDMPVDVWQKYASPVWMDINQSDTLQFRTAKANNDEKHICPLQLGVIERAITLWSNPGDVVFSPFMGIGSEVYQAAKMGRKGVGIELKNSYFDLAKRNMKNLTESMNQLSIV